MDLTPVVPRAKKRGVEAPFPAFCASLSIVDVHGDFKTETNVCICGSFPSHVITLLCA